jgi:hypothetical protein
MRISHKAKEYILFRDLYNNKALDFEENTIEKLKNPKFAVLIEDRWHYWADEDWISRGYKLLELTCPNLWKSNISGDWVNFAYAETRPWGYRDKDIQKFKKSSFYTLTRVELK